MPTLTVVVGNPSPRSRTQRIAVDLGERLTELLGGELLPVIDLADYTGEVFRQPSEQLDPLVRQLADSDYAVISTPTYKASYTGLLKAFLDRYPAGGLSGVTAVPVFTIGSPYHSLAVEHTLRPLLVELGASVPTQGLAFETSRFEDRAEVLEAWISEQSTALLRNSTASQAPTHEGSTE